MRKYRLRVGLDVDDTVYDCNDYALQIINARYLDEEPISINEIKGWGNVGRRAEERLELFGDPKFVSEQPILHGAQKFVRDLSKMADVFFITAVSPQCMTARVQRLIADFPEVPADNIIIGTRKDVMLLDILLDDGAHNIAKSRAAYPVLFRKPWNAHLSGLLSVNSYDDFLHLCKMTRNSFVQKPPDLTQGGVVCLVGPSGSRKNEIANILSEQYGFVKPLTTTTRPKRESESHSRYRFVTEEQFLSERDIGTFIETTVYSKYYFGLTAESISAVVDEGKCAIIPIDICGALTLKNIYRTKAMLVFTNRERSQVILDIIARDISDEDKMRRIMSLDFEYRNSEVCDMEVTVDDDAEPASAAIADAVSAKK